MIDTGVALVRRLTTLQAVPLVPELPLLLAEDALGIWQDVEAAMAGGLEGRPFWAFAWPGGQAKARVVLDHPDLVRGRTVLDIGTGSGIAALAAAKAGAKSVMANDTDPLALIATQENAKLNGLRIQVSGEDLLSCHDIRFDVVLLSDVVYEPELEVRVGRFIETLARQGTTILYADRSTARLPRRPVERLGAFEVRVVPPLEEKHIEQAIVWRLA